METKFNKTRTSFYRPIVAIIHFVVMSRFWVTITKALVTSYHCDDMDQGH